MTSSNRAAIHLFDVVALASDLTENGLLRGQVGTIVETLAPRVFEVEFSDDQGQVYAQLALSLRKASCWRFITRPNRRHKAERPLPGLVVAIAS